MIDAFNPQSPGFLADPYPVYAQLRMADPVHWVPAFIPGAWLLTSYSDITTVLKDQRFGRDRRRLMPAGQEPPAPPAFKALMQMQSNWMLFKDPPDHTRLRGLVSKAFTPRMIDNLRTRIEEVAEYLLNRVATHGGMDLMADYAYPLPVIVISELLGVSPEDRDQFREWSVALAASIDPNRSPADLRKASSVTASLSEYIRDLVTQRRREPQQDLISGLIHAEEQGQHLTEDELIATCILLLAAGHETTVNTIGNSVLSLAHHPAQMSLLKSHPDLISPAVDELLRYESPVQMTFRVAMEDAELGGKQIKRGQQLALALAAGNRDPEQFINPDDLDLTRNPNPHLAFASGIHFCLGANLGRAEVQIAVNTLLRCVPNLTVNSELPRWRKTVGLRSLGELPITF